MSVKDSGEDRWIPSGQVAILPFSVPSFSFLELKKYMHEHNWLGTGWTLLRGRKVLNECLEYFERWVTKDNPVVAFDHKGNPLLAKRNTKGEIVIEKTNEIPQNTWALVFKKKKSS
ncbi:MAG: hypothetical protein HGA67_01485 [Candidatus Yonathbacteria bacterium]|nr:hypothetical protein [Candidatus Yonathbacteria bacterium]